MVEQGRCTRTSATPANRPASITSGFDARCSIDAAKIGKRGACNLFLHKVPSAHVEAGADIATSNMPLATPA